MIVEKKQLTLSVQRGFPMYFLCVNKKTHFRITFSDLVKHSDENLYFIIGNKEFKCVSITEIRLSKLDYGTNEDVYFHDCACEFIGTIDTVKKL